jgi:hypothetical protein
MDGSLAQFSDIGGIIVSPAAPPPSRVQQTTLVAWLPTKN